MKDRITRRMLRRLKNRKGCSFEDLDTVFLQETAGTPWYSMDQDHTLLSGEHISLLIRLGLVEAWQDGKRLSDSEAQQELFHGYLSGATYFITERALHLEELLGTTLDSDRLRYFGEPHRWRTWPEVFVLMPFAERFLPIYEDHIRSVMEKLGLTVARADDFFTTGSIIQDVWSAINMARIIIADCTSRNPNVFYEVGIAHTLGKETILLTQDLDDIPFDLRHFRIVEYKYSPREIKALEGSLQAACEAVLKEQEADAATDSENIQQEPERDK